jgi:nitrogen fixation protein
VKQKVELESVIKAEMKDKEGGKHLLTLTERTLLLPHLPARINAPKSPKSQNLLQPVNCSACLFGITTPDYKDCVAICKCLFACYSSLPTMPLLITQLFVMSCPVLPYIHLFRLVT